MQPLRAVDDARAAQLQAALEKMQALLSASKQQDEALLDMTAALQEKLQVCRRGNSDNGPR